MKIRVGETIADLRDFNRITITRLFGREFLVGVMKSGRTLALFAVRPAYTGERVIDVLTSAFASGKWLCILSAELAVIADDEGAARALDDFNFGQLAERDEVARPNTLEPLHVRQW